VEGERWLSRGNGWKATSECEPITTVQLVRRFGLAWPPANPIGVSTGMGDDGLFFLVDLSSVDVCFAALLGQDGLRGRCGVWVGVGCCF
jgi:hypothetical protein